MKMLILLKKMSLYVELPFEQYQFLKVQEYKYSGNDYPFHYHPEVELTCVLNSNGIRIVGDNIESYLPDDLVLIGPNLPHIWQKAERFKEADGDEEHIIVIHINSELLEIFAKSILEMENIRKLLNEAKNGLTFSYEIIKKIKPLLFKLLTSTESEKFALLFKILSVLSQDKERRKLSSFGYIEVEKEKDKHRITEIHNYLLNNFQKPINAGQVARKFGFSYSAFSHYFKKRTTISFKSYLNRIRLGHASKLLQETDIKIAVICYQCGFNNLSNFNRAFKNRYKCSPKIYRRKFVLD